MKSIKLTARDIIATCLILVPATARDHFSVANIIQRYESSSRFPQAEVNSSVYPTRFDGVTWDDRNWLLTTTTLQQGQYQSRGSVANGYLGINVASVGPFFELDSGDVSDFINGWPLFSQRQTFATISGFYDLQPTTDDNHSSRVYQYGRDSVISGVPHWSGLILDLGDGIYLDATVDNRTISDFRSTYDFKAGLLSWSYTWTPPDKGSYAIRYRLFANKLNITQAVVDMEIVPGANTTTDATIVNVLDGHSAVRSNFAASGEDDGAVFSAVRPWGVPNVTAYIYANLTATSNVDLSSCRLVNNQPYVSANDSSIAQAAPVHFTPSEPVRVTKFVGGASTDAFANPQQTARQAASAAQSAGYMRSLHAHFAEWAHIMDDQSVDRFTDPSTGRLPDDDHVINSAAIAVANTYYLLQNTVSQHALAAVGYAPVNAQSIAVSGLTSDSYAGLIFWDADLWMQPGLVASHPEAAQAVTNYRVAKYDQAVSNINTVSATSKNQTYFDQSAAIYPWTSGRFGDCTSSGPCWDYQYHLNGDIGLSMIYHWIASGDTSHFRHTLFPIYDSIATLYSNLVQRNGSPWTITHMTDPDEYANDIDAGGFTMSLVSETLTNANRFREQFGLEPNDTWTEIADNVLILRENGVTLEYTTMDSSTVVKQADIVLITYPLVYNNYTTQNALNDLDYYANKQSADGPAMTWGIFSIVASQLSPSGCSAYTYHQYAYEPYTRGPFFQLSEQMVDNATVNGGTHPAYPFLTGHGGVHQIVLFGYLGLRLLPDNVLHVNPNPPPQLPHIAYRTFYWRGWPISARSNVTHTTLQRATHINALNTADLRFANTAIPVQVGSIDIDNKTGNSGREETYMLSPFHPLTIPNRRIGWAVSSPGNTAQCQPILSHDPYAPGQFPISVVDGATSTRWQPASSLKTSAVTVDLGTAAARTIVTGFRFDWAQMPPVNATVLFHGAVLADPAAVAAAAGGPASEEDRGDRIVATLTQITPSKPYRAGSAEFTDIAVPVGNTTEVQLDAPVPAARYATLLIVGNQGLVEGEGDVGATVAEWAIISPRTQMQMEMQ